MILERKKFCFSHWERFLIFYVHFLLFFPSIVAPFYRPRRSKLKIYCVSVPFGGLLKAFSSFIWKKFSFFASCCLIFWNINDDYTERKVFHAWFSSALRLPSHILTHSINVYVFAFRPRQEISAYVRNEGEYLTRPKTNLNKWFLIYVLRVSN